MIPESIRVDFTMPVYLFTSGESRFKTILSATLLQDRANKRVAVLSDVHFSPFAHRQR